MKRPLLIIAFILTQISATAQSNPFEIETVTIDKPQVEYNFEEAILRQQQAVVDKTRVENKGWAELLQKILKEIAAGIIPSAEASELDPSYFAGKTADATSPKAKKAPEKPAINEPKAVTPSTPSGKGVSTGSANFKAWFDEAAKFGKEWQFPTVTNKYGKTITPEDYLRAIIWIESRGIHKSSKGSITKSYAGALGFMQLMPNTAKGLKIDANDAAQNLKGGAKYLKEIFNSGNVSKKSGAEKLIMGACAYNLGPFSKSMKSDWDTFKNNSKIPVETRGYGLKLKMCLGLELSKDEEELVRKHLLPKGKTVAQLADENYAHTHGIAK